MRLTIILLSLTFVQQLLAGQYNEALSIGDPAPGGRT